MADKIDAFRKNYRYFLPITTRWKDNDAYGHINNVTYYSYFDTVANTYLVHEGGLNIETSPVIGLVIESKCTFKSPLAFPDEIEAGLRIDKLGGSSVVYGIAIFKKREEKASAFGHFVHVFVDRENRKPVKMPAGYRSAFEKILAG